jgi:hypothetical protein
MDKPGNATAKRDLKSAELQMARDRQTALTEEDAADRDLHTSLAPVDLPSQPTNG